MKVAIISADKTDGLLLTLEVLPRAGDVVTIDHIDYRVHKVLHKVDTTKMENGLTHQQIAIVLDRP